MAVTRGLDGLFNLLVVLTVVVTAVSLGLGASSRTIWEAMRRRSFVLVVVLNVVAMPVIAFGFMQLVPIPPEQAMAVVLCATCAGGPMAMKASQIARADLSWAFSLTIVLLVLNLVTLPLWSTLLMTEHFAVQAGTLFMVLILPIVVPVAIGVLIGSRLADPSRWVERTALVSTIGLVAVVAVGIFNYFAALTTLRFSALGASALGVIVTGGIIGWLIGDRPDQKRATSLVTLNRATSVALLAIAQTQPDNYLLISGAIVFGLVQTTLALGVAIYWRSVRSPHPADDLGYEASPDPAV